ncbi:MAG: phosphodiester glycosidase family protein [Nitrospiraceae bacterium]
MRRHSSTDPRADSPRTFHQSTLSLLRTVVLSTAVVCLPTTSLTWAGSAPWDTLDPGLEISLWAPGTACPESVSAAILRVDPERYSFAVHYFREAGLSDPIPLSAWRQRTGAALVLNAGLFFDDYTYMGWLVKNGEALSAKRHAQWQGLFVAEPIRTGLRRAGILDLAVDEFTIDAPSYAEAAQALMLVDRQGKIRVRQSGKRAQQTLLAEDGNGSLYVVKTMSPASLFGLATCIRATLPWLQQVMAMDGGSSSDVMVGNQILSRTTKPTTSLPPPWRALLDGTAPAIHIPLPTVIAVYPRSTTHQPTPRPNNPQAQPKQ